MRLLETLVIVVAAASTAIAYPNGPLEIRNDLDFALDNLETLLERDLYDDESNAIEILRRDIDSDTEDFETLFTRQPLDYAGDSDTLSLLIRDLQLPSQRPNTLSPRDPGVRSNMRKGSQTLTGSLKKTVGACLGCMSSANDDPERSTITTHHKNAMKDPSIPKSTTVQRTGNFLSNALTGPAAGYMSQMAHMDPVIGGFHRPSVIDVQRSH